MRARIDRRTGDDLRQHLAEASGEALVTELRALDPQALERWLAAPETARTVVTGLLARLESVADPERLSTLEGRATFAVRGSDLAETLVLGAGRGGEVVIRAEAPVLVRLISGAVDAALLHLSGDLDIEGDASLALDVGAALQIPGEGRAAVDPTSLDPVDVATACDQAPAADATLILDGAGFLRLVTGQLHPVRGVLTGAVRVRGDRAKALTFNQLMTPPRPRGR